MSEFIDLDALGQLKEFIAEKFPDVVEVFDRTSEQYVLDIVSGLEDKNTQRVVDAAHPLKSSSGNLGLVKLSSLCSEIEDLGRAVVNGDKPFEDLVPLVGQVQDIYSQSIELLKAELN